MRKIDLLKEQLSSLKKHDSQNPEIPILEQKILRSKRGKYSKTKGATYESKIKKILNNRFKDLEFSRTPASGGFQKSANNKLLKGDIVNLNEDYDFLLHIECKNQKNMNITEWWKQAEEDSLDKLPVLFIHRNQEIANGKRVNKSGDYVYLRLEDFLNILDDKKIIKKSIDKT